MRNLKFVRYGVVLLGFVVLCTKAQNGFCPMCTNNFSPYPPVPNAFGGSFGGKIRLLFKGSIFPQRSFIRAALVSFVNTNFFGLIQGQNPAI